MTLRHGFGAAAATAVLLLGPSAPTAAAQDGNGDRGVILEDPPIIPEPNTGRAPEEAGDRGGALQLTILGLLVAGAGGAVAHLVRQGRRARSADRTDSPPG